MYKPRYHERIAYRVAGLGKNTVALKLYAPENSIGSVYRQTISDSNFLDFYIYFWFH